MTRFRAEILTDTHYSKQHVAMLDETKSVIEITIGKRTDDTEPLEEAATIRLNKTGARRLKNALNAILQTMN